jgi:hypothetical protein
MKAYGEVDVYIHVFLTSVLVVGEWSTSRSNRLYAWGKSRLCPLGRRLGGPGTDLDEVKNILTLLGLELPPLGRLVRSQSLYRVRYPGS